MTRLLHLADLHLDWEPPWEEVAKARKNERDARLEKAVSFALEHGVHLVVIAGDLFETHRPDASLVRAVKDQLARLVQAGIACVTVPGNHDEISYHDSVYRTHGSDWPGVLVRNPNFERVAAVETPGGTVTVYSMAYTAGLSRTDRPLDAFPKGDEEGRHIAVLHGSLDWDQGDRSVPIDRDALLAAGYDYVALGHIHKREVHGRGAPAVYCGMIDGKGFDDPGVGCYTVVDLVPGGARVETVDAGSRSVRRLRVDAGLFEDEESLVDGVRAKIDPGEIVRIVLTGVPEFPVSAPALHSAWRDKVFWLEVRDETEGLTSDTLDALAKEPTVRGAFVARMIERIAAASNEERAMLKRALTLGLKALEGGPGA